MAYRIFHMLLAIDGIRHKDVNPECLTQQYQLEALTGLLAQLYIHSGNPEHRSSHFIYTNRASIWSKKYLPFIYSLRFLSNQSINLQSLEDSLLRNKHHFLLKVEAIYRAFTQASKQGYDVLIFQDGDHISLRPWTYEVVNQLVSTSSDVAMSFECGHVSLVPYPTYNSGLIALRVGQSAQKMLDCWLECSRAMFTSPSINLGDQHSLVHALGIAKPKVFALPDVYNLRCHDVYNGIAPVWSPIYAIHNHILATYVSRAIFYDLVTENPSASCTARFIDDCNTQFTPKDQPFQPRVVRIDPIQLSRVLRTCTRQC